jgi:transposase
MQNAEQIQPYFWILGIDVSKESIDACLVRQSDGQLFESKFHNNLSGFRHLKAWCKQIHLCVSFPLLVQLKSRIHFHLLQ